jgi:single-strand DNA-binding protein
MINKATFIGNVGKMPDVKRLENGTPVAKFSLATNKNYKDKDGEWQTITQWHNIVAWREKAETVERSVAAGAVVYVEGEITYRKYKDKNEVEHTITEIIVDTIRVVKKSDKAADGPPEEEAEPVQATSVPVASDDLPF